MKLLTKEIRETLPPLHAQEGKTDNAIVYLHYMSDRIKWDWYALEGSLVCPRHSLFDCAECPEKTWTNFMFFGLMHGMTEEFGLFSLAQLEDLNGMCLNVKRDLDWTPKPLSECGGFASAR